MKHTDDDQLKGSPPPDLSEQFPPGYTVVHTLQQLREAKGPVWVSCMTMLLREIEESQKGEIEFPESGQLPRF